MDISIIVAYGKNNRLIGLNNKLPWHISDDLKRFKKITMGHFVVFGRKTFESLPKYSQFVNNGQYPHQHPLPGRKVIVLSANYLMYKNTFKDVSDIYFMNSLEQAISFCKESGERELFIAGGSQLYQQSLAYASRMYITEVNLKVKDVEVEIEQIFFPDYQLNEWIIVGKEEVCSEYIFKILEKNKE
ncbi:MAG: dihydrofolate reductase [Oligoflexia bacterium]|nr:dihydrofolate reductase [Oligoflexia bacterium]